MITDDGREGTVIDHLQELRWAILRCLLSVLVLFPAVFHFAGHIIQNLVLVLCPPDMILRYFSPMEPLLVKIKLSAYVTMIIASPYLLKQIWGFVAPGLLAAERRVFFWLVMVSWVLFMIGCGFSLWLILPLVMNFSAAFQTDYLQPSIGLQQFVSLAGTLALGFGVVFQLPAIVYALVATGLVSPQKLKVLRPVVLTCILLVSAVMTPPDVISQLLMALPAYILYEAGIMVSSMVRPARSHENVEDSSEVKEEQL